MRFSHTLLLLILTLIIGSISCLNEITSPSLIDELETDRAWQFLHRFSIYTDRIVSQKEAQVLGSPQNVALKINDTLRLTGSSHVTFFTYYSDDWRDIYNMNFPIKEDAHAPYSNSKSRVSAESYDLYCEKLSDSILYVLIPTFMTNVDEQMRNCPLINDAISSVILDLRWNGGGYVNVCTTMVDIILPQKTPYLKTLYRNDKIPDHTAEPKVDTVMWTTSNNQPTKWEGKKYAILMNGYSASASEILIAGVRDNLPNCYTVGTSTFGKAIGQSHFYFNTTSGGGMSITSLSFYRKNGGDYHHVGIAPDSTIKKTDRYGTNQLIAAATKLDKNFSPTENIATINSITAQLSKAHSWVPEARTCSKSRTSTTSTSWKPIAIVREVYEAASLLAN